ncbi:MAG: OmpA family protein [Ignavibacteria bacterium]|nr:OmpA family protein [Ignavibacteria bacterium]
MTEEEKKHKEEPIIIKKKKGHTAHAPHGGSWKVAYADFVTAMMAFFIVMWILGQSEQIRQMVSSYFKDPGAFNFLTGKRTVPVKIDIFENPESGKGKEKEKHQFYFFLPPEQQDTLAEKVTEKLKRQAIEDSLKAIERVKNISEEIKSILSESSKTNTKLEKLVNSLQFEFTKEGLRIELIEGQESVFFEIGSAKLKPEAKEILSLLAVEIGKLPNLVEIEGHTDSRQYAKQSGYGNWELSADRANAARRVMEENGLWQGQVLKVTGFADKNLKIPENPFDFKNRRTSILVKNISTEDILRNYSKRE